MNDKRRRRWQKWMVISDLHSVFLDHRAFDVFLQIYRESEFHQLIILGDLLDLQALSSHKQRFEIMNPVVPRHYDLHEEIDFTIENILQPIHRAKKGKVPIMFIPGNHCRRLIRGLRDNTPALQQLVDTAYRKRSLRLEDLLRFDDFGIELSLGEDNFGVTYVRRRGTRLALLHGYKTGKNRLNQYLDYFQCNVLSGHTHQDKILTRAVYGGQITAAETMCLRTRLGVEFLDEGHDPGWVHGMVTVWIDQETGQMFIKQHRILDYRCEFHGQVFAA